MSCYAHAQTTATGIEGKVLSENEVPADAATVRLLSYPDSAIIRTTISDKSGYFEFKALTPGSYFIQITKVGYRKQYTLRYQVVADNSIKTPDISLIPITKQLKEITITDKREFVEVRPDKTVLNVDKSIVASGNSILDVLRTAPGVKVMNDEVIFKGGQKALIAINGKTVLLSGDQLSDLLKSYQSANVSQVELISNPSAKYDAAGGGLINIVLKKNKELGLRVSVFESASIGDKYKLNTGFSANYRTEKFNLFGNYNFSQNKIPRTWDINRNILMDDVVSGYDVKYLGTTVAKNHNFNIGADFIVKPGHNIGVLVTGYVNPVKVDKTNTTNLTANGILDSTITSLSTINRRIDNINYNLNYKGTFGKDKDHTLSADFDLSEYDRRSFENLRNDFLNVNRIAYRNPVFFEVTSPADINIKSFKVDYSKKIGEKGSFETGVKYSDVNSDNQIDFEELVNNQYTLVPSLTDHFTYKERIKAGYVNYTNTIGKADITIGVRAEETNANRKSFNPDRVADTSYFNLFPTAQVVYEVNDKHELTFNYNRRIGRPNYQDLNPFVAYIDKYAYSTGNPFLRPQYTNAFEFSDTYLGKYKATVGVNLINAFYTTVYLQNDVTGVYTTTKNNFGNRYQYNAEFNIPVEVTSWWQISNYLSGSIEKYTYNAETAQTKHAYDMLLQVNQTFVITPELKAEFNGSYETPTYFGIKSYREQYYFSAGLSQAINTYGSVKLAMSDIFNTYVDRYNTRFMNLDLKGREKAGTRFVTLSFTYRFGNQSVKSARKRVGGAVDEQTRLSGSSSEN
ncbi:outer membrane beta-barrel family protein [Mucilaginibacter gynuensis]|uniref:Outer membrane beta-barrel family protein n=1 Tax=Mucilaginibacter gynuensis TaxID=1302236 RepID=A0ABP8GPZ8_9SPHI